MRASRRRIAGGIVMAVLATTLMGCPLGRGSKKLGEECKQNNDCADANCQANLCTRSCASDSDCASAAVKMVCKGNDESDANPDAIGTCGVP